MRRRNLSEEWAKSTKNALGEIRKTERNEKLTEDSTGREERHDDEQGEKLKDGDVQRNRRPRWMKNDERMKKNGNNL
ncbi:hypothetical protein RUM43_009379 [Polyplax serrata]|uniref:Uncharacterized protein n=1 Tax=Polyplax serrata TaxID=468196 RepID=A0AAN8PCX6_POLSC